MIRSKLSKLLSGSLNAINAITLPSSVSFQLSIYDYFSRQEPTGSLNVILISTMYFDLRISRRHAFCEKIACLYHRLRDGE